MILCVQRGGRRPLPICTASPERRKDMSGFVIGDRSLRLSGDTHSAWLASHAQVGSYLVVGASAVGQIHLARGLPRDDAFAVRCMGPWLAAAASA